MTFKELKQASVRYRSAFYAEAIFPKAIRRELEGAFATLVFLTGAALSLDIFSGRIETAFLGIFFISLSAFLLLILLCAFCISAENEISPIADLETMSVVFHSSADDLTRGFLLSDIGEYALLRAGADPKSILNHLSQKRERISAVAFDEIARKLTRPFRLSDYALILLSLDSELSLELAKDGVGPKDISSAADWVSGAAERERIGARWWGADHARKNFTHWREEENAPVAEPKLIESLLACAAQIEEKRGVFFTYPAISSVAEAQRKRVIGTIAPEKAREMLHELAEYAIVRKGKIIDYKMSQEFFA